MQIQKINPLDMQFNFKKRRLKTSNKLLLMILSSLGFSVSCELSREPDEYGTPCADFIVNGTIKSKVTMAPIPNLKLSMDLDTVYSDSKGNFVLKCLRFPQQQSFVIKVKDIDEAANGSFKDKDTIVNFPGDSFAEGDGHWYKGKEEQNTVIYLDPKP
jgi:putative lipoprotein (rSAM/lipoprotein system)